MGWFPGELQHGFMQYAYDGYLWWKKTIVPEYEEYTYQTSHYRDMYWTLNQVQIFLFQTDKENDLTVLLDTVTPNLKKLMVRENGGEWKETESNYIRQLQKGKNRLEAKSVNAWDLDGIISEIIVYY